MISLIRDKFNTELPLPSILPTEWGKEFKSDDNIVFDSLDNFVYTVSKLTQREDNKCGISYEDALRKLVRKESDFPESKQDSIRNLVRNNLLKRGLITEEIYENFKYASEGTQLGVDVAKYAAGEADCVITPSKQYVDYFYELYISISYGCKVTNNHVRENVARLLATIEELERMHIFIKVNVIFPARCAAHVNGNRKNFFSIIPIFSHKDTKNVSVMSSVVNEKLLRKFLFACLEDFYGKDLVSGYGQPVHLPKTINIGHDLDEVELFENIVKDVGFIS